MQKDNSHGQAWAGGETFPVRAPISAKEEARVTCTLIDETGQYNRSAGRCSLLIISGVECVMLSHWLPLPL